MLPSNFDSHVPTDSEICEDTDDDAFAPSYDSEEEIGLEIYPEEKSNDQLDEVEIAEELEFVNIVNDDRKGYNDYHDNFFGFVK